MRIKRSKTFLKHYAKLSFSLQQKTDQALERFFANPFDITLRNHTLNGRYLGCRSIDVTGDYRIIFCELSDGTYEIIELIDIGKHAQLYG